MTSRSTTPDAALAEGCASNSEEQQPIDSIARAMNQLSIAHNRAIANDFGLSDRACPICLDELPPYWKPDRCVSGCCGGFMCRPCWSDMAEVAERQGGIDSLTCALCRGKIPDSKIEIEKQWLAKAAEGVAWAQFHLGSAHTDASTSPGLPVARPQIKLGVALIQKSADQGYPLALYKMGSIYEDGKYGVKKSLPKAVKFYDQAVAVGHATAASALADIYLKQGDITKSCDYLELGSELGCGDCSASLGVLYFRGLHGVEKCTVKGVEYLKKAADQTHEHPAAYHALADVVAVDEKLSLSYLTLAADLGDLAAMLRLGAFFTANIVPTTSTNDLQAVKSSKGSNRGSTKLQIHYGNVNFPKGVHYLRRATSEFYSSSAEMILKEIDKFAPFLCFNPKCNKQSRDGTRFQRCARCRVASYCSKGCSRAHWKEGNHKEACCKFNGK